MTNGLPCLHVHLDGSIRPRPALDGVRFHAGMGIDAALGCFKRTLEHLQTPIRLMNATRQLCDDMDAWGVGTLELRFAPNLHGCADPRTAVQAVASQAVGRAGIILCGLYGDPPEVFEQLAQIAANEPEVVGIDLAGAPDARRTYDEQIRPYADAFADAKRHVGITVHAAEGRPPGEIRDAINILGADRIGHGTTLMDDPSVVELVVDRRVTIEACPTSNVHTGAIPALAAHPIVAMLDAGVRVCINPDNTLLSGTDPGREHYRVLTQVPGMDASYLQQAVYYGHYDAFKRVAR